MGKERALTLPIIKRLLRPIASYTRCPHMPVLMHRMLAGDSFQLETPGASQCIAIGRVLDTMRDGGNISDLLSCKAAKSPITMMVGECPRTCLFVVLYDKIPD